MSFVKHSDTFNELVKITKLMTENRSFTEGFILKYINNTSETDIKKLKTKTDKCKTKIHLTSSQMSFEYRAYRLIVNRMVKLWVAVIDEVDSKNDIKEVVKNSVQLQAEILQMKEMLTKMQETPPNNTKYEKEIWTLQEAAEELGITKKSLATKISKFKKNGVDIPWIIVQENSPQRIRRIEFLNWVKGNKKAGRPFKNKTLN